MRVVQNQNKLIDSQLKLYAELTKGGTVFELPIGYWLISSSKDGRYAWCRAKSDGKFNFLQQFISHRINLIQQRTFWTLDKMIGSFTSILKIKLTTTILLVIGVL